MPEIEIYDDTWKKLQEFKKVTKSILGDDSIDIDSDYVDLVLIQGLEKMIGDIMPQDPSILTKNITNMFNENPEYVSRHIFDTLERGNKKEEPKEIREKWQHFQ